VVLVLVSPLLRHSLLTPPLEEKLIFVAISPTIATMIPYGLRLRLGMGLFIWFLSTRLLNRFLLTWLLNRFLLTRLLTFFPKNTFPKVLLNLIGFWKSLVCGGNTGGVGVVSSRFLRWFGLGTKVFLWRVFGGSGIFSPLSHQPSLPQALHHLGCHTYFSKEN
jgi:hypothetical protein